MPNPQFTKPWHGVPRDQIQWNPSIIEEACIGCGTCVTGCSRLVYRFDFDRKGPVVFAKDEHNRPETTAESLSKLKPAFRKDGTITAGNAPWLNTGAAAILGAERGWAEKNGMKPTARLVSYGLGAVAAIALACLREIGFAEDVVNVDGGAIAHSHPIGASGAVLTTRLLHSMQRDGLKRGIVTLCIGGGQGIALAVECL